MLRIKRDIGASSFHDGNHADNGPRRLVEEQRDECLGSDSDTLQMSSKLVCELVELLVSESAIVTIDCFGCTWSKQGLLMNDFVNTATDWRRDICVPCHDLTETARREYVQLANSELHAIVRDDFV
jgi:hypothetical protein